jgi:LuxR family maltose regulon positive regulatory protein
MLGFVHVAEREPERICPVTAGRIHCLLIGLPGVSGAYERFAAASRRAAGPRPAPWQLAAAAVEGVSLLWHGEFERSAAALRQAEVLYRQFGSIRLVAERLGQLRAIHATACGRLVEAITFTKGHIEDLRSAPELERHRVAWLRAYRHALARMYWIAGRQQEFVELLPVLTAPRTAAEWLYVDVAADVVRGQAALLRGEPQAALEPLTRAGTDCAQHCLPFVFSDPRIVLAYAWLSLRERAKAWEVFEPVYAAAIEHREFGPLLLEQPVRTAALLDAMPSGLRASAATGELRATLGEWTRPSTADGSVPAVTGPLARLTEREREVLAAVAGGAGNKHIARALDLSLHTVKRHIANILDKLDCASRGQAADLYRRATG